MQQRAEEAELEAEELVRLLKGELAKVAAELGRVAAQRQELEGALAADRDARKQMGAAQDRVAHAARGRVFRGAGKDGSLDRNTSFRTLKRDAFGDDVNAKQRAAFDALEEAVFLLSLQLQTVAVAATGETIEPSAAAPSGPSKPVDVAFGPVVSTTEVASTDDAAPTASEELAAQ